MDTEVFTCPLIRQLENEGITHQATLFLSDSVVTIQIPKGDEELKQRFQDLTFFFCRNHLGDPQCVNSRAEQGRLVGRRGTSRAMQIDVRHMSREDIKALFPGIEVRDINGEFIIDEVL